MNPSRSTSYSNVYREFRAIEASEWRTIIRFYEEFEPTMDGLDFQEYFEMLLAYAKALFEIGAFEKHIAMADKVIEVSMMNNVKFFNGEDVFQTTLFKKAASNYQLHKFENCDYILRELLRIDPYHNDGAMFLRKCLRKIKSSFIRQTRGITISLILLSAIIVCIEVVVIRSLYPEYSDLVKTMRNAILLTSFIVLVGGDVFHRLRCSREVDNFVEHLKKRKKRERTADG